MGKNKKLFILLGIILVLLAGVIVFIVMRSNNDEEVTKELKENTYEVVVSINPLVEFTFIESYYECTNNLTKKVSVCSEYGSKVSSYDLLNDDAKKYFADTDFTDLSLTEVLTKMRDVLLDNGVNVDTFSITTDGNIRYSEEELKEYILNNSTYDSEFAINISVTDNLDVEALMDDTDDNTTSNTSSTETSSNSNDNTSSKVENTCTSKKFSNKYSYVYETMDTCKSLGDEIFYDYYDNVDDSIDLWNCEEIVDDCGTTWYGLYFLKYDSSISDYKKLYV